MTDGLVALYEFKEGSGMDVKDTSGQSPPADLKILDLAGVEWMLGALQFKSFKSNVVTPTEAQNAIPRIVDACNESNAFSVEAWIKPSKVTEQDDRVVAFESSLTERNFTLIQRNSPQERFSLFNATKKKDNKSFSFSFESKEKTIRLDELQHVVAVFSLKEKKGVFYVDDNEQKVQSIPDDVALLSWLTNGKITLGNSTGQTGTAYAWEGEMHLVAIYCKALSKEEVQQNFIAGADP